MTDLITFTGEGLATGVTLGVGTGAGGDTPVESTPGTARLTVIADDTHGRAFRVQPTRAGDNGSVSWTVPAGSRTLGLRVYLRRAGTPDAAATLLAGYDTDGAALDWRVGLSGSGAPGQVRFYPKSGFTNTPQNSVLEHQWYRVEAYVKADVNGDGAGTDGQYRMLTYLGHHTTALHDTGWVGTALGHGVEQIRLGSVSATPAGVWSVDFAALTVTDDADTLIGPTGVADTEPVSGSTLRVKVGGVWKACRVVGYVDDGVLVTHDVETHGPARVTVVP